jgi:hypothetical protein
MTTERNPCGAGIGLRLPHLAELAATRPAVRWLEVHPENFIANPHATELLGDLARDYPVSVHTVGVSVGSARGLDRRHLARVRAFVERIDPVLVSGHLAWSTHAGEYLNDLLPLPYDSESLQLVAEHLREVQDTLGRRYLLENPSSYLGFIGSTMTEVEFLRELVHRTGCLLLCDVSNVYVSARNMRYDAHAYIDGLRGAPVAEFHLGGFTAEADEATPGATLLVDTHAAKIVDPVWDLYAYAVRHLGAAPTLVEWDNEIPSLATLLAEAARADAVASGILQGEILHVAG